MAAAGRPAAQESQRGFGPRVHAQRVAGPAGLGSGRFYSSHYPADPRDAEHGAHRSRLSFYAFGSLAVFAVVLAAYVISHRNGGEPTPGIQVVGGAVLGPLATPSAPAAHTSKSAAASHSAPPMAAQVPLHHVAPAPVVTVYTDAVQKNAGPQRGLPDERVSASKSNAGTRPDVARNLASARASLDKDSLWPARRAITNALAEQPNNADAQQLRTELTSREQERDALLGYARLCEREARWVCVWQNAGHAVTLDTSSQEARRLLARAIAEQGAGTARQVDSGPPGPDADQ